MHTTPIPSLAEAVARTEKVERLAHALTRNLEAAGAITPSLIAGAANMLADHDLQELARREGIRYPSALTCAAVRRVLEVRAELAVTPADPFAAFQ